ncbi:cleavage furrow ingression [Mactra antiquata]
MADSSTELIDITVSIDGKEVQLQVSQDIYQKVIQKDQATLDLICASVGENSSKQQSSQDLSNVVHQEDSEQSCQDKGKVCACKGIRTCSLCESIGKESVVPIKKDATIYSYCYQCKKAWSTATGPHPQHSGHTIDFPGIYIQENFISEDEESSIMSDIYKAPFIDSQSGRRKQDFGPKVNFKKKKLKTANFSGLPPFSKDLLAKMQASEILQDFIPVEQCHLEYTPERGSAIDPHFDDFWVWGERLVTINLLSDTELCFTMDSKPDIEVHVPMNRRSLLVVYGKARTVWKHAIHRSDIKDKRIAVTLRELSKEFSKNGPREAEGKSLLDIALTFNGVPVA